MLNEELKIADWLCSVRVDRENSKERLEEHGTENHLRALWLRWVKIFNVDRAELKIGVLFIYVIISEGRKRYVDVV